MARRLQDGQAAPSTARAARNFSGVLCMVVLCMAVLCMVVLCMVVLCMVVLCMVLESIKHHCNVCSSVLGMAVLCCVVLLPLTPHGPQ